MGLIVGEEFPYTELEDVGEIYHLVYLINFFPFYLIILLNTSILA